MSDTTTVRVIKEVHHRFRLACVARGDTVQAATTEALQDKIEQWQHGGIFFYCTGCGKRMWEGANWDHIKGDTLETTLALLLCSDCLLAEVRADDQEPADG